MHRRIRAFRVTGRTMNCVHCKGETKLLELHTRAPFCNHNCRRAFWSKRGEDPQEVPKGALPAVAA